MRLGGPLDATVRMLPLRFSHVCCRLVRCRLPRTPSARAAPNRVADPCVLLLPVGDGADALQIMAGSFVTLLPAKRDSATIRFRNAEGQVWDGEGEMPDWLRRAVNAGQSVEHFRVSG